jgi:hypothetical protein
MFHGGDSVARLPTSLSNHMLSYLSLACLHVLYACASFHKRRVSAYISVASHLHLTEETRRDVFGYATHGAYTLLCAHARNLRHISIRSMWPNGKTAIIAFAGLIRINCATLRTVQYPDSLCDIRVWDALATCPLLETFDAVPFASVYIANGSIHALRVVRQCRNLRALTLNSPPEEYKDDEDIYDHYFTSVLTGLRLQSLNVKRLPIRSIRVLTGMAASLTSLTICLTGNSHYRLGCAALEKELPALTNLKSLRVELIDITEPCDETCVWRSSSLTTLNYKVSDDDDADNDALEPWPCVDMPLLTEFAATHATIELFTSVLEHSPLIDEVDLVGYKSVASDEEDMALCHAILSERGGDGGGGGSKLEIVSIEHCYLSINVMLAMAKTWHRLAHCTLVLPRSVLGAVPVLLRALAHTLETCNIREEEYYDEEEDSGPRMPSLDASTDPIRMEWLTELELPDDLWTSDLCRVLQCPQLPTIRVKPQTGACVSLLVSNLDACDCFTLHLDPNFLILDPPCPNEPDNPCPDERDKPCLNETVGTLPEIRSLKIINVRAQSLESLLSWFPFLTTLEIDASSVDVHQTILLFQNLAKLGRTEAAQYTITRLTIRLPGDFTFPNPDRDMQTMCRPFVDIVRAFPHVDHFELHPLSSRAVREELEALVEARSNIVRDRAILAAHNL